MKTWLVGLLALLVMVLFLPVAVSAQVMQNPKTATFTCSEDHATVTSYQMGLAHAALTTFIFTNIDVGKPTMDAEGKCQINVPLTQIPLETGLRMCFRAVTPQGESAWGEQEIFDRVIGVPGKPVLAK